MLGRFWVSQNNAVALEAGESRFLTFHKMYSFSRLLLENTDNIVIESIMDTHKSYDFEAAFTNSKEQLANATLLVHPVTNAPLPSPRYFVTHQVLLLAQSFNSWLTNILGNYCLYFHKNSLLDRPCGHRINANSLQSTLKLLATFVIPLRLDTAFYPHTIVNSSLSYSARTVKNCHLSNRKICHRFLSLQRIYGMFPVRPIL